MRIQQIYPVYNPKNIQFKALPAEDLLRCDNYSEFKQKSQNSFSKLILGDDIDFPMKFKGVDKNLDCYFNLYGAGKFRLMLMPNKDGFNNFANYLHTNKKTTLQSINRVVQIIEMTHPKDDFYIFESGASEIEKITNIGGVIPAHLHFITNDKDTSVTLEKIESVFTKTIEGTIIKFKNISIEKLYQNILKLTQNGDIGYKFIGKKLTTGLYDSFLYIKENDDGVPKSQSIPKVLSIIFNNSDDRSHFNWKKIDTDPRNWNPIIMEKIKQDRRLNREFLNTIKKMGLLC